MAPPRVLKDEGVLQWWRASDDSPDPRHAGKVDGADRTGDAGAEIVFGVWLDRLGRVRKVRWVGDVANGSLVDYAEVACALLESGVAPASVDAAALRRVVNSVPAGDQQLADVVAAGVAAALCARYA